MAEDKDKFVQLISDALRECDPARYGHIDLVYRTPNRGDEWVECIFEDGGSEWADINKSSLVGIMGDIARQLGDFL